MKQFPNKQSGAVLAVSLIFLVLLTIIGISNLRTTSLEQRMAGNSRDQHLAFEAAEASLRQAETFLDTIPDVADFNNAGGDGLYASDAALFTLDPTFKNIETYVQWTAAAAGNQGYVNANTIGPSSSAAGELNTAPKFVVQFLGETINLLNSRNLNNKGRSTGSRGSRLFRITARGTGGSDNSVVYLQTVYGTRITN